MTRFTPSCSASGRLLPGLLTVLACLSVGCSQSVTETAGSGYVYPGLTWNEVEPASAGFDEAALEGFVEHVGGHGCVVRKGHLVKAWGRHDARADVASAAKPVYTHLVLKTLESDRISCLDDPVAELLPELNHLNGHLGYPDREITWRHLVTQTSGYGVADRPGEAFDYNDLQMALLADLLVTRVYETPMERVDQHVLEPLFSSAIGCEDEPTMYHHRSLPGRLRISVRDFARFGHLYLSGGRWDGRQVLSEEAVALATSSPHPPSLPGTGGVSAETLPGQRTVGAQPHDSLHLNSYSYCWWLNGVMDSGRRVLPSAPEDTYGAFGHGARHALIVVPSLDLVVVWTDGIRSSANRHFFFDGHNDVDAALKKLMESIEA